MSEPASNEDDDVLSSLRDAVDGLLEHDFTSHTPSELVEIAVGWETELRRMVAVTHSVVGSLGSSGAPGEFGYRDVAALLVDLLRLGPGEARSRVRTADLVGVRQALTGEALSPVFAVIAEAQRAGTVSGEQVRVILGALDALPVSIDRDVVDGVEQTLVTLASQVGPRQLATAAQRVVALADPDGQRPNETEKQRRRGITFGSAIDGLGRLDGCLAQELLAVLHTVLDPLSAPSPSADGVADPRTAAQRRHDALLELCQRALRWGDLPPSGGVPTTLILTMTEKDFRARQGFATTVHGDLIPADTVHRLVDQAEVYTVVLTASGGVLDYGRDRRLATAAQRCVIYARDGGCTMPGCTTPSAWCQLHHVSEWIAGGRTAINNMTLLCGHHHRTFEQSGWKVIMQDGVPWWIPPQHLDPQQRPRQNHYWQTLRLR